MRIGYVQKTRTDSRSESEKMRKAGCQKIYLEKYQKKMQDWKWREKFRNVLEDSQPGDTIVIQTLEHISLDYQVWLEVTEELKKYRLELEVLDNQKLMLCDWDKLFKWIQKSDQKGFAQVRVTKVKKETQAIKDRYRLFSKNPYFRRVYIDILQQIMAKRSLRQITKSSGAPLSAVVRIRKEYAKLKQTLLLIATFFLTIICLKMVQLYSTNFFLQFIICGVMTLLIVYLSYSDSQTE